MNKMTKGAVATGLGIALLIGGGGTLAVWNAEDSTIAGTIAAGDLDLVAEPGTWTSAQAPEDPIENIGDYKIVPGDTLTFTQPVKVTLEGNQMAAKLEFTGQWESTDHLSVITTELTDEAGKVVPEILKPIAGKKDVIYTAKAEVKFKDGIADREGTDDTAELGKRQFKLEQVAPIPSAAASTLP